MLKADLLLMSTKGSFPIKSVRVPQPDWFLWYSWPHHACREAVKKQAALVAVIKRECYVGFHSILSAGIRYRILSCLLVPLCAGDP